MIPWWWALAVAATGPLLPVWEGDGPSDALVETLLTPGDFPQRRFVHVSTGDEALYCTDASLDAATPFVQVFPDRLEWPKVGGIPIEVVHEDRKLAALAQPVPPTVLDAGFSVEWVLRAQGMVFVDGVPRFRMHVEEARVRAPDGRVLFAWEPPPKRPVCTPSPRPGHAACVLEGISRSAAAVALSGDGTLAAVSVSGLHPQLVLYDVRATPTRLWHVLFPSHSGGVQHAAFSRDGRHVVALLANGEIHRFDAPSGQRHFQVAARGASVLPLPPGDAVAVGREGGQVTAYRLSDATVLWRIKARSSRGTVMHMAASSDGTRLATVDYRDQRATIRVFDIHRTPPAGIAQWEVSAAVSRVVLDDGGTTLFAVADDAGVTAAPVRFGSHFAPVEGGALCRTSLWWDAAARHLWCIQDTAVAAVYPTAATGPATRLFIEGDTPLAAFDVSQVGTAVAAADGRLYVWRPATP